MVTLLKFPPGWIPALFAAVLPLTLQSIWLWHNTQLPIADAVEQLLASFRISEYARQHEWFRFFTGLYDQRNSMWRPTGFYILQVPFQLISGGDLMFTTRAITIACTAVACLYTYSLLRLWTGSRESILGTAIIGMLAGFQYPATYLAFSECAFLPAILGSVYHLIRSEGLQDRQQSRYWVMAVFIAFAIRPVETLNHLVLLLVLLLVQAWRQKRLAPAQCHTIITGGLTAASLLISTGWVHHSNDIFADVAQGRFFTRISAAVIASTLILWSLYLVMPVFRKQPILSGGKTFLVSSFIRLYVLVTAFYLPYVAKLVVWIYTCSFGSMAMLNASTPTWKLLLDFVRGTGSVTFMVLSAAGALSCVFCLDRETRRKLLSHQLLYLFSLVPVTLLMTLTSAQFSQRKITVVLDVFLLAMLVPVLMRGRWFAVRIALLLLLAGVQCYGWLLIGSGKTPDPWLQAFTGNVYPPMVTAYPNPNDTVSGFMTETARQHGFKTILLPIATDDTLVDPFQLTLLNDTHHTGIVLRFPFIPLFSGEATLNRFLDEKMDAFLLINDFEGTFTPSPEKAAQFRSLLAHTTVPNEKLRLTLALYAMENGFEPLGIRKTDCRQIDTIHREACIFAFIRQ